MRYWIALILLFGLISGFAGAQTLTASPSQISLTVGAGQTSLISQDITITNPGSEVSFSVALQPPVSWATASVIPLSGVLPANASIPAVRLQINPQSFVVNNYYTSTIVVSPLGRTPLIIPVTIQVVQQSITVEPSSPPTFTQRAGTTASYPFQVNYVGPGSVTASLTAGGSWITLRPLVLDQFPSSVTADVNTTGLVPGTVYEATITFRAPSSTAPARSVVLRILVSSSLTVQPKEITFSGTPGSAAGNPPQVQVTVSNFGDATTYTITPAAGAASWLRVSKQSGSIPQNGSDTFNVSTDASALSATGEVAGAIEVAAPGRTPEIITVRLQLSGASDISASPATLTFTGQAGALTSAPNQATVTVTNSGPATGYTISANQSWIVLSKNAGAVNQNGSDTFTVAASPQFQTVGTKTGTITIAAPGRAPRSVNVTFNVTETPPPPELNVNPDSLAFSVQAGMAQSVPSSTTVVVANVGSAVGYTVSADQSWVVLDKLAGTIPENGSDSFPVRVTGVGQTAGTKTATITVAAPGRTSRTITITMNVTSTDPTLDLTVTPGTLTFAGQVGTTTSAPTAATVTVHNVGAATTYSVVVDQAWLSVTKSSGSLAENGTDTFNVSASPQFLPAGTRTGNITVSSPGRPSRTVVVTFNVTTDPPPPDLIVSPTTLSFSANAGETTSTPAAATVTLTNIGAAVGFALAADQPWIDLPSLAGSIPANGTATFTVGAKPQGLTPATRTGTVSIAAPGRPARSVQISFTVRESPASADMTVAPQSMAFVGQAGAVVGIPTNVLVTINNAGAAVPYTLAADQGWIILSKTSGNLAEGGSDTFTVAANPQSQTPGTKTGTITVLATGRPTRTIQVSFTVTVGEPPPELLTIPTSLTFAGKAGEAGGTPSKQSITVTNVGAAVGYTVTVDQPWLSTNKLAGAIAQNATDTVEVSVSGQGQTAGVKTGTIQFAAPGRTTKTVNVTFNVDTAVQPSTDLTASPSSLAFTSVLGQLSASPSPWRLTLANTGPAVTFLAVPDQPWIVLDNLGGTLPADGSAVLLVSVNTTFISTAGSRTGNILISAPGRPNRTVTVTLNTLTQEPAPDLVVLPSTISFNQPTGQPAPTPTQALVQVGNIGPAMGYVVSVDQTWVTLSKNSGNVAANGTDTFSIAVNSTGLTAGTRLANVLVTSPGRPNRSITVSFTLGGTGGQDSMSVTPTSLTTTGATGGASTTPASTTITVSNTGASVQYSIVPNQTWIITSKSSGTLPSNGTDTFTITTLPLNLAVGTYQGTVIVLAPGRPQVTINVTMILTATGQVTRLESFPPQIDFFVQPGGTTLGQSMRVVASDASTTSVNVLSSSSGWLSTTPGAITTPGQVAVNVTSAPLNLPLSGIVSLAPASQGVLSADVPVNLRNAGPTVYNIPRVVDGGGFVTTITIANLDTTSAIVSLRFRRALVDTTTVTWTPNMEGNQATENVVIPPGGSFTWRTRGLGNQVEAGWAQVICAQKIGGFAIYRQSVAGRADQEAAVPLVSTWQQRILMPFDNTNNLVTSMAITNSSETENGDVRAIFRDENGQAIQGSYRRVLPPLGHVAFATTDELSFLRNRRGTAEFVMTGGRMSAVGLRFAASAFTSFEVQSLNTTAPGRLIIPQIANAGGFFTTITVVNKDVVPALVSLRFFRRSNSEGATEPWNPPMVGISPITNVTIPVGSSYTWQTTGSGNPEQGWAEVLTNQQVGGFAVFLQRVAGRVDQEAAVPVNAGAQQRFLLPYDNSQPFTTTMALANFAEDTQALIVATVRDEQNLAIGPQVALLIPVRGHLAFPLPERFPQSVGRRGTVEFQVQFGSVSALGLRFAGEPFTSFKPQVIQ